eukprot:CAMPEP_0174912840 /NCGR_PEP_ID=MMETSP0167-20121228/79997_1 /TAXON_ID=38298 /ORGANISM="Rhodella maculata, Strain CCMP736" /LENGTH=146 /DNA_ID=CAMNT_0016157513 /DNA_START=549 /DNA_END=989 /DNA_ORIENTATION=-
MQPATQQEDASRLIFGPEFDVDKHGNAPVPISIAEAAHILRSRQSERSSSDDVTPIVKKTEQYIDRFDRFRSDNLVQAAMNAMEKHIGEHKLHVFEAVQLINLLPDDAEEAKTIIPSLNDKVDDDVLNSILKELKELTNAGENDSD